MLDNFIVDKRGLHRRVVGARNLLKHRVFTPTAIFTPFPSDTTTTTTEQPPGEYHVKPFLPWKRWWEGTSTGREVGGGVSVSCITPPIFHSQGARLWAGFNIGLEVMCRQRG